MSDIFKELPVRIIGFSFGIGQAARYRFSAKTVDMCNGVGTFFVIAHVVHNAITEQSGVGIVKTICFEAICSCIIPPVLNYYLCGFTADILGELKSLPNIIRRWGPFIVGILTIPVLIIFVDPEVDNLINSLFGG